ncbi:hypothetical protein Tco_0719287 [Tanacetum coccineum]
MVRFLSLITVTYTSASEDDLYMGSPGVEVPVFEVPPSPDYIPGPEGPPSPDYVPGPEEPEQAPPSPIYIPFVPEPVYPEFLPVDDEVFPAEEQPLPAADSPTHHVSRVYTEFPSLRRTLRRMTRGSEEVQPTILCDRGDDEDEQRSELLGLERDALPVHETEMPEMCLPLRKRPCRTTPGPGCEVGESSAAGAARQDTWDDLVGAIQEIAPTTLEGVNQRVIELSSTVDQEDEIIYSLLDDARYDRAILSARVSTGLDSDRPFHRRTSHSDRGGGLIIRVPLGQRSHGCTRDQVHLLGIALQDYGLGQQSEIQGCNGRDRRRQAVDYDLAKKAKTIRGRGKLAGTLKISESLKAQDDGAIETAGTMLWILQSSVRGGVVPE